MKSKKLFWIIPLLILIPAILVIIKIIPVQKFYLEDKYYTDGSFIDIETDKLNDLINNKESFALFIYQPACVTSSDFEQTLHDFITNNNIKVYKIAFSNIKETTLSKSIKYYPSFVIFNKGKMVDYLDAESDNDLKYYESKDEFQNWFTSYVLLKKVNKNNISKEKKEKENEQTTEANTKEISLDNIKRDENKVNIYFFWGSTCPHCKEEFAFFEKLEKEYGKYYNLYTYEVWENEKNAEIMNTFAAVLNEEAKGVPYTIIGDKSFTGFNDDSKENFIETIKSKYQNSEDVYFDKVKNY